MAGTLPRMIVIESNLFSGNGYAYYNEPTASVLLGEPSVFSTLVKIEAERAKINPNYVHLRFTHSNKYWQRKANDNFIVAQSNKPDEDTGKPTCTLFEAIKVDGSSFYLTHVQSGGRVLIDSPTLGFYVDDNPNDVNQGAASYLSFVDWDTLVKLPKNIAFKGFNDSWLGGIWSLGVPYLQFSVDDPTTAITTYKIDLLPNGHVRIYSNYFNKYCRRSDSDWIVGESSDASSDDADTLFWPVKLNDTTIALRNVGNGRFCICHDADDKTRCLNAGAPNITNEAKIVVQELVMERRIYNVRYRMEDARIYDETPYVAGRTTAFNYGDKEQEASVAVEINYEDSKSYSFSRSLSISAGVKSTFEVGVPLIEKADIEVSFEVNTTFEWNDEQTTKTSVKATGTVPVPPKSMASVTYVGTRGTCDVPFNYTQQDMSSTDGKIIQTDLVDGVFRGTNCYNFTFEVDKAEPL